MHFRSILLSALFLFFLLDPADIMSTVQKEAELPQDALKPVFNSYPSFRDDMDFEFLSLAIRRNISYLTRLNPKEVFDYGPHQFTCAEVLESQQAFLKLISDNLKVDQLNAEIRTNFRVYRASGDDGNNKVLFTGYYDPVFDASLTQDDAYKYPIYRKPDDLQRVDLSLFDKKFKGESIVVRIQNNRISPYYTRYQIEVEKVLDGKGLALAWFKDPIDAYLLHIQGAGKLRLPDGKIISVGYQGSNGRTYRSFGRYLLENGYLSPEQASIQNIRRYLAKHPEILDSVLTYNDSYVFFNRIEQGPVGNINVPLTIGRSLALDEKLFPKGALVFISTKRPCVNNRGAVTGCKTFSRFVLNQDTGSAIKGAGRADLFFGSGPYAEIAACNMKHYGDVYVLIKNP